MLVFHNSNKTINKSTVTLRATNVFCYNLILVMMAQLFNGNEDIWNVLWQSDHFHVHYFLSLGLIC